MIDITTILSAKEKVNIEAKLASGGIPNSIWAVSYTHLMVCTVVMNGVGSKISVLIHIPFGVIGIGIKAIPVSYTHLDVYKRQPQSPVPQWKISDKAAERYRLKWYQAQHRKPLRFPLT